MYSTSQTPSIYSYSGHDHIYSYHEYNTSLTALLPQTPTSPTSTRPPSLPTSSHPAPLTSHPTRHGHYRTPSSITGQKRYSGLSSPTTLGSKRLSLTMGSRDAKMDGVPRREKEGARELEPRRSFGIGGAGNIRRPSDVIYPSRCNADGTRRSGIFCRNGSVGEGKRSSILSLFRRG